jgi:hypothetical protein
MKKSVFLILIVLLFIAGTVLGVYNLVYQTVEGTVGFKAINGYKGSLESGILHQVDSGDGPSILVNDKNFKSDFTTPGNVTVDEVLAAKLDQQYSRVSYFVGLNLETEERLHPVHRGEGLAYHVTRVNFDLVNAGDRIQCRVSRWNSMSNIKILSSAK